MEDYLYKAADQELAEDSTDDDSQSTVALSLPELTARALRDIEKVIQKKLNRTQPKRSAMSKQSSDLEFGQYLHRLVHFSQVEDSFAVAALILLDRFLKIFGVEPFLDFSLQM